MSDNHMSVWPAFAAAQAEFKSPAQSGINPHFKSKYSTLGDIFAATMPALRAHGLVFTQQMTTDADGHMSLVSRIVHAESGDSISSTIPLASVQDPQKFGSLLSYMKRYAAAAMFAVVDGMDDDGEAASQPTQRNGSAPKPAPRPQAPQPAPKRADDNPFDDKVDAEGYDIIAGWQLDPEAAKQWAVDVAACANIHEARNSLAKIVNEQHGGKLNKDNVGEVLVDFYLHQVEKMEALAA